VKPSEASSGSDVRHARFRRVDESDAADWRIIGEQAERRQHDLPERVLGLLRQLAGIQEGFPVNQEVHALQTAARAEKAGASDELILAALCHDIGKVVTSYDHAPISAAILRPHVSPEVTWAIEHHQAIQVRHYGAHFGMDTQAWRRLEDHPAFPIAWRLVEEWDKLSFDPDFPTPPLEHFEPLVRTWFGRRTPR
jgi:predicted HD phosphohydrolase